MFHYQSSRSLWPNFFSIYMKVVKCTTCLHFPESSVSWWLKIVTWLPFSPRFDAKLAQQSSLESRAICFTVFRSQQNQEVTRRSEQNTTNMTNECCHTCTGSRESFQTQWRSRDNAKTHECQSKKNAASKSSTYCPGVGLVSASIMAGSRARSWTTSEAAGSYELSSSFFWNKGGREN